MDDRAFAVILADQVAAHLRLDLRVDEAVECADPFIGDRHVGLLDGDDVDGHGAHGGGGRLRVVAPGEERGRESNGCGEKNTGSTGGLQPIRSCTTHPVPRWTRRA